MNRQARPRAAQRTLVRAGMVYWLLCALSLVSPGDELGVTAAWAQSDEDRQAARAALAEGDRNIEKGDRQQRRRRARRAQISYQRALENYRRAYDLVPTPSIFYAIAGAEEKLGRYLDAVEHFQRVVDEVSDEGLREDARTRIAALSQYVATVILTVEPAGAEVSVDGSLKGQAPLGRPVYLNPGDHVVTVTADGYSPYEASMTVAAGQRDERTIELSEVPVLVQRPKSVSAPSEPSPSLRIDASEPLQPPSKLPVFMGVSVTVALLVGATVTGVLANSEHSDFNSEPERPRPQLEDIADRGRTLARVTDGFLIGAAIAGAYSAYQYWGVYLPERKAYMSAQSAKARPGDPARTLWVAPYAGAQGGGVAVGGRF